MVLEKHTKLKRDWIEYILINYRWVFVLFVLLPLSFFYNIYDYFRAYIVFRLNSAPKKHGEKVAEIQKQVKEWAQGSKEYPMCTGRPGWQTISFRQPKYKKTHYKVHINLVDILEIDTKNMVVRCEPLVSMGQLTQALIHLGWTIPVVPEMDDLTVGGLVMGTGIETSSHKEGLFQHICVAFEMVLSDASVVLCSPEENSDLFYSVPWSYGTLGFLTAVHIKIIPALRFVRLEYRSCKSETEFVKTLEQETLKDNDNQFIEGITFSAEHGVVMTGNMCNSANPNQVNEIGRWYKPWFFKHVQDMLSHNDTVVEFIPLRDYYHRHTRSIFWELQDIIPFGNNIMFRYLLGWLVPPKVSLLKLTQGETVKRLYEEHHFIQDMLVPLDSLTKALQLFEREVKIHPIWLCPFKLPPQPGMLRPYRNKESIYVDIGTYGEPKVNHFDPMKTTRIVEKFVRDAKGFQMMYADSYMTREEYRQMFDHTLYDKLRNQLQCKGAFPEVYDKVNRKARD